MLTEYSLTERTRFFDHLDSTESNNAITSFRYSQPCLPASRVNWSTDLLSPNYGGWGCTFSPFSAAMSFVDPHVAHSSPQKERKTENGTVVFVIDNK